MTERDVLEGVIDGQWLLENYIPAPVWVAKGFIPCGLTLFAAEPKSGKTWNMMGLAVSVCKGEPFMGYETVQGGAIYLALEDTSKRFQTRLQRLTDEIAGLHVLHEVPKLGEGFKERIEDLLERLPGTTVVIVDTLQMVRSQSSGKNVYASDYADASALKKLADAHGIAIVAVHHTRKDESGSAFARVSGSNGLTGAADETIVVTPSKGSSSTFDFDVTGRDVEKGRIVARFDDGFWSVVEKLNEREIAHRSVPGEIKRIADFLLSTGEETWSGSASELMDSVGIEGILPHVISKKMNEHRWYLAERGIAYELVRSSAKRSFVVTIEPDATSPDDAGDAHDAEGGI